MPIVEIDPSRPAAETLARAASIIRAGGLVAFPTETVYGLGANALDEGAIRRIFAAKGRPSYNPLIAHVADLDAARALAAEWPEVAERLASRFWPGPLTLVVAKRPELPDALTAGLPTAALRVPAHPVAHALIATAHLPIAAPSANRFTELSPTTARHVEKALGDRVDLILDGGPTALGIESTVIDVSGPVPVLLRPGSLSRARIEEVAGPLLERAEITGATPRPAPGMVGRHYAPRATLVLFSPDRRGEMAVRAAEAAARGLRVGALLLDSLAVPIGHPVEMPSDPERYARALYAALHDLDDHGCDLVLVDAVPDGPAWAGIRDRLARATQGR